jgi:adenylate kinase family enzyme
MRRVVVGGSTGAGKSTFARALGARLGVPVIELDALRHGPGWTETPDDVFRERVAALTAGPVWVVDGNYSVIRAVTWGRADTLVWLDYPFRTILWRLFWRTNRRVFRREILWNGNRERFGTAYFSRDSLYVWLLRSFWRRRRTWPAVLAEPAHRHLRVVRLRDPRAAAAWLARLPPASLAGPADGP